MKGSSTLRHPGIDLLRRYVTVLRTAWRLRHELAGPSRLAHEAAFLPAALSLQETPVHPAPRRAMAVIVALFAFALLWSVVGRVDIVAVAPGRVVVSDGTKLIQPLEAGVVRSIRVRDGDRVAEGAVLVELDPTSTGAERRSVEEQLRNAQAELIRADALRGAVQGGLAPAIDPVHADAARLAASEWSDIQARLSRLDAEMTRRRAELVTAQELQAKLEALLPPARQRENDLRALASQGFVAPHAGQDRTRERIALEHDLSAQQARVAEAQAAVAEQRKARAAYVAETVRGLDDRIAEHRLAASQLSEAAVKSAHREQQTVLRSPIAGTVQQLAVHTAGGVVTSAQPLMVIVPDDATLTARVSLDNKDIGFVREGQPVAVKLTSFPFTKYGTVPGTLAWVARDAVVDEQRGSATFPAIVHLGKRTIDIDGRPVSIGPGLEVTAEIRTGRRRLIEYLASPLQKHIDESGKER